MKDIPQGGVVTLVERIQVASQAASEHHRLLIEEDGINDPSNIVRTCGMMEIFALRSWRPNLRASMPSMTILPVGSASRKRAVTILDLPAPARNPLMRVVGDYFCQPFT